MPMMILFFRNADRILRAEKYRSVQKLVSPLLDLELVRIHSVCSEHYLTFLLQQCINVKEISLGMMTDISDKVWSDVLAKNSLQKLEKISCQKCTKVHNSKDHNYRPNLTSPLLYFRSPFMESNCYWPTVITSGSLWIFATLKASPIKNAKC